MKQTTQFRSSLVMGSLLQSMASKPKSKNQHLPVPNANAHQTTYNVQVVPETMANEAIHVGPHFNMNILKRYKGQCSVCHFTCAMIACHSQASESKSFYVFHDTQNKQPSREAPVSQNFSQRIIAFYEEEDSDDECPLARFPIHRPQPKKVKKNHSSQRDHFIGNEDLDGGLSRSDWSPGRGLAIAFGSHCAVTGCGPKEPEEPMFKFSEQLQRTPPRPVHQSPSFMTPGLTISINTPLALGDLITPTSLTDLASDDKVIITSSILRRSVAPVSGRRVQFGPSRVMDDWEIKDDDCTSDNESLIDPFLHRRGV
ncbi:hypothetical protein DFH28DRAFT_1110915 [Melampsora americana]|nr:hypothetical protein DFH28DRAFT_1110915 [Melampsora americana]